jgi:molecular chaperone GrpE
MPREEDFDAVSAAAELEEALAGETDRVAEEVARAEARLAREMARELGRRTREVLVDLLGVLDDLERALDQARRAGDGSPLRDGVELVERNFLAALGRHGVTRVAALGEPFDPALHEGVTVVPASSAAEHGRVVAVLRSGYRLGDELLRPAAVAVARAA